MTAGVSQASNIAVILAPAGTRSSLQAEKSSGGFGEALGAAKSHGGGAQAGADAKVRSNAQHWRQHSADADATTRGASAATQSSLASEAVDGAGAGLEDGLLDAAEEAAPHDADTDREAQKDGADTGLPMQIKAEQAISAMMAMVPMERRGPAGDKTERHAVKAEEAGMAEPDADRTHRTALSAPKSADRHVQPAADLADGKPSVAPGTARTDAGAGPGVAVGSAMTIAAGTQSSTAIAVRAVAAADAGGKVQPTDGGKADRQAGKPAKAVEAQSASTETVASVPQTSSEDGIDADGARSGSGSPARHDAASEPRRVEPLAAKVSVVSAHAAPAPAAPAPGANVAAIVSAIEADWGWRLASGPAAQSAHALRSAQPMRSLKIQLHPAELGMVTANLRVAGEQLSVELQVDSHEAYHRLSAESDAIIKSLRSLGYDIDHVSIQQPQAATTTVARADAGGGTGSFSRDASSFQPGSSGSGGERLGGQTSGRGHGGDAQRNDQAQPLHQNRAGSGLYI
jgi:flagellar hook-length control protein FliK